ncbi:MAG: DUF3426 domain-containing protein [Pseudomonadota bacterium]
MYTQCPHCLTLFRISSEELKAAAGKARCCQCNQVFNALETLQENPVIQGASTLAIPAEKIESPDSFEEQISEDSLFTDTLNLDSDQLIEIAAKEDTPPLVKAEKTNESFMIKDDGLETEPDYLAAGSELQMSELLDSDSAPFINTKDEPETEAKVVPINQHMDADDPLEAHLTEQSTNDRDASPIAIEAPDTESEKHLFRFTERQKDEQHPSQVSASGPNLEIDEIFEKQRTSFSSIAWGTAGLLLILLLLLQLSWQYRERVIQNEYGRQLLTKMCNIAGCTTPERRDTSQIFIQHRDLRGHPSKSNALLLQLSIINRADFAQPFPKLHLSLFNDREKLIAHRTFEPLEYISDPNLIDNLMQQSEPVFISMELVDPGKDVTGFKFEFL